MTLHSQHYGEGSPLIMLHGLFGSADNWTTLGKRLSDTYSVYLVDQRNHGRSGHSDVFNYDVLAEDLLEWMDAQGIVSAHLLGHSMGGKTVMRFAQKFPERVKKMVVVDIGVKAYPPHHGPILEGLKSIDLESIASRGEADDALKVHIADFGTRQFLLKSLYRNDQHGFAWRINIPVLEAAMPDILGPIPEVRVHTPTLFVRGMRSDYILKSDFDKISKIFANSKFVELPAGHWVHAEDPDGLERELRNFVTD